MLRILYSFFFSVAAPFLLLHNALFSRGPSRFKTERRAIPSHTKPSKPVIWFHGASLGEVMSLMPIIKLSQKNYPNTQILVTTSSKNSGDLVASKLPDGVIHQFLPYDLQRYVKKFINYWKPSVVLWVESDFWPNIQLGISKNKTPLILLNGRISQKSFNRWRGFPPLIKVVIKNFSLVFAQSHEDFIRLSSLGNKNIYFQGNIKFYCAPLTYDQKELMALKTAIGNRPFWLAASTHSGEEEIVAEAHNQLKKKYPNLLTIIVPRHPKRRNEVLETLTKKGLSSTLRSENDPLSDKVDVYIGDTLGEMGLFYSLSPFCFLGGSLMKIGGHTPVEPALLNCGIITGPYVHTNACVFEEFYLKHCIEKVFGVNDLVEAVDRFMQDPVLLEKTTRKAYNVVVSHNNNRQLLLTKLFSEMDKSLKDDSSVLVSNK